MNRAGKVAGGTAIAMAAAIGAVSVFEGRSNEAYLDPVGVATICDGITHNVELGDTATDAECDALLRAEIKKALTVLDNAVEADMPPSRRAALASFIYNVGPTAFRRSTLRRKLQAGDVQGACDELLRWVYAGGRDCRIRTNNCYGIVTRRQREREMCLDDGGGLESLAGDRTGDGRPDRG